VEVGGLPASKNQGETLKLARQRQYQELLSEEMYLLQTMSNAAYTISTLTQVMAEVTETHWKAALRSLKHLKGNDLALIYR
jgi:hypothetical protein